MTNRLGKKVIANKVSPATLRDTYNRQHLCPDLKVKETCFRAQRYKDGTFEAVFHEHVPSNRLSLDSEIEVLRGLVDHCAGWPPTFILHSRLNNRRGGPPQYPGFRTYVTYPEEGVIRRYFSSGHATAWSDAVIVPDCFRQQVAGRRSAQWSTR